VIKWVSWVIAGVLAAALIVIAALFAVGVFAVAPMGPGWTSTIVSPPVGGSNQCFWVNSTANNDRFCMTLSTTSTGYQLSGTYDHGVGTTQSGFLLNEPTPTSGATTAGTWTSPHGGGMLSWSYGTKVTISALN
jgi:hypothetical protein